MSEEVQESKGSHLVRTKNGAIRDTRTGRFVDGSEVTTKITPSNSVAYHQARKEKTKSAIRKELAAVSNTRNSITAVALAAGRMWEDVLNPEVDLEKRRKAWLSIGKQADLLSDNTQADKTDGQNGGIGSDVVHALADFVRAIRGD